MLKSFLQPVFWLYSAQTPVKIYNTHACAYVPDPSGLKKILSLGQFRPEKDHASQIRAMFALRQIISEEEWEKVSGDIYFYNGGTNTKHIWMVELQSNFQWRSILVWTIWKQNKMAAVLFCFPMAWKTEPLEIGLSEILRFQMYANPSIFYSISVGFLLLE